MRVVFLQIMDPQSDSYGAKIFEVLPAPFDQRGGHECAGRAMEQELRQFRLLEPLIVGCYRPDHVGRFVCNRQLVWPAPKRLR